MGGFKESRGGQQKELFDWPVQGWVRWVRRCRSMARDGAEVEAQRGRVVLQQVARLGREGGLRLPTGSWVMVV